MTRQRRIRTPIARLLTLAIVVTCLSGCGASAATTSSPGQLGLSGSAAAGTATTAPTTGAAQTALATLPGPTATATQAPNPLYSCTAMLDGVPATAGQPVMGQVQPDMGRLHVSVGTPVTYMSCPPASGPHYNSSSLGPIAPRFYSPEDATVPQNWVHNLEHGGLVILYRCASSGCDQASLDRLRQVLAAFPPSPICQVPGGVVSPVITRFDDMKAPFAAVLWNRVLLQDELDVLQMLQFFANAGEQLNPESYCQR